jgi:hypothetical protein
MLILLPVVALAAAQLFDFFSFLAMIGHHGLDAELNPLVVHVAQAFDLRALAIMKLAVIGYVAATVAILARSRPRAARGVLAIGIVAGLVGGVSNIASI